MPVRLVASNLRERLWRPSRRPPAPPDAATARDAHRLGVGAGGSEPAEERQGYGTKRLDEHLEPAGRRAVKLNIF